MEENPEDILFTTYYHWATNISAPFGLICSILTLTILICIFKSDRNNVNHLPTRAIWLIAISDIINHSTSLVISNLKVKHTTCKYLIVLTQFSYTLYTLTNLLIAYILHMNYLRKSPLKIMTEIRLWIFNIVISITAACLLSHFGIIGYLCADNCILIDLKDSNSLLVLTISFHSIQLIAILYSLIVIIIVKLKLMNKFNRLLGDMNQNTLHDKELSKSIKLTLHSSLLFPLAGIISMPPMIGVTLYSYINEGKIPYNLVILKHSLQGLCGFFTLVALILDPNIRQMFYTWRSINSPFRNYFGRKEKNNNNNNNTSMVEESPSFLVNVRELNFENLSSSPTNYPNLPSTSYNPNSNSNTTN